jgi:hypothetical protein
MPNQEFKSSLITNLFPANDVELNKLALFNEELDKNMLSLESEDLHGTFLIQNNLVYGFFHKGNLHGFAIHISESSKIRIGFYREGFFTGNCRVIDSNMRSISNTIMLKD